MDKNEKEVKSQSVSITLTTIIGAAINGIVGYVAVYFFKPLWEKLIKWWKNESNG